MKILLVNKFHYYKGGAETFYLGLGKELEKQGHKVAYFSMKSEKNLKCEYSNFFVKNREYNNKTNIFKKASAFMNFIYSFEAKKNLTLLIKEFKPDLIILNNIHRQITTSIIDTIKKFNIPVFWVLHDLILLCPCYTMLNSKGQICDKCKNGNYINCLKYKCVKDSRIKSLLASFEAAINKKRNIVKKIDYFITPSKFYMDLFINNGIDRNRICYLGNPFFPTEDLITDSNFEYFLYFGRLSREKGIINLIKCFSKSRGNKLIICGDGPLKEEIEQTILNCKLNNVVYVGFKTGNELNSIIANSKCVIIPSEWYENSPYSGLEAMYFKKPLIVSYLGGLPELIKNNGFVFHNNEELVEQINYFESLSKEELIKYGTQSFALLNKEHNTFLYTQALISLFNEIINKK